MALHGRRKGKPPDGGAVTSRLANHSYVLGPCSRSPGFCGRAVPARFEESYRFIRRVKEAIVL